MPLPAFFLTKQSRRPAIASTSPQKPCETMLKTRKPLTSAVSSASCAPRLFLSIRKLFVTPQYEHKIHKMRIAADGWESRPSLPSASMSLGFKVRTVLEGVSHSESAIGSKDKIPGETPRKPGNQRPLPRPLRSHLISTLAQSWKWPPTPNL